MRRLMLLRHGKAESPGGVSDLERPLAKRGKEAVPRIAAHMAEEQLLPDLALVSPARRARETWDLVAAKLGALPARSEPRIYESPAEQLLAVVRDAAPELRALLLVGHHPGLEELALRLVDHGDRFALARMRKKYPTAGLAVIDFAVEDWRDVKPGSGRLDRFVTPKSLGQDEDD